MCFTCKIRCSKIAFIKKLFKFFRHFIFGFSHCIIKIFDLYININRGCKDDRDAIFFLFHISFSLPLPENVISWIKFFHIWSAIFLHTAKKIFVQNFPVSLFNGFFFILRLYDSRTAGVEIERNFIFFLCHNSIFVNSKHP